MATSGLWNWEEFYRIDRMAESAYLKLSAREANEFLRHIRQWIARV
jgi:hypothetical protein